MPKKIHFPANFYRFVEESGQRRTSVYNGGEPDLEALWAGDPECWLEDGTVRKMKPKIIILTAWTMGSLESRDDRMRMYAFLRLLLQARSNDYDVRVYRKGRLVRLTKENFSEWEHSCTDKDAFVPATLKEIKRAIAREKRPVGHFVLLDDIHFNRIKWNIRRTVLLASDLRILQDVWLRKRLHGKKRMSDAEFNVFAEQVIRPVFYGLDECDSSTEIFVMSDLIDEFGGDRDGHKIMGRLYDALGASVVKLGYKQDIRKLNLEQATVQQLLDGHTPKARGALLKPYMLDTVKKLGIRSNPSQAKLDLYALLSKTKKLNILNLYLCNLSWTSNMSLGDNALPDLEALSLKLDNPDCIGMLAEIAKAAKNLSELQLIMTVDTRYLRLFKPNAFPALWHIKLTINKLTINSEQLMALLTAAPDLGKITVAWRDCRNITVDQWVLLFKHRPRLLIDMRLSAECAQEYMDFRQGARLKPFFRNLSIGEFESPNEAESTTSRASSSSRVPHRETLPSSTSNRYYADADTTFNPNRKITVDRSIIAVDGVDPHPNEYRSELIGHLEVNKAVCKPRDALILSNSDDLQFRSCSSITRSQASRLRPLGQGLRGLDHKKRYIGRRRIVADGRWQALPSLRAGDVITHYSLDRSDCEFRYSARDDQYYVRSRTRFEGVIALQYLFYCNPAPQMPSLPEAVAKEIGALKQCTREALDMQDKPHTGEDYLNALIVQRKGACRHRASVFKVFMQRKFPHIACRIIQNQCHSFVELKLGKYWYALDLGGYPVALKIEDSARVQSTVSIREKRAFQQAVKLSVYEQAYRNQFNRRGKALTAKTAEEWVSLQVSSAIGKKLIKAGDAKQQIAALSAMYAKAKASGQPVFLVEKVSDMYLLRDKLVRDGHSNFAIPKKGPCGPLYEFLQLKNHPKGSRPIILINYANFRAEDIVKFNDALDDTRRIDSVAVPPQYRIRGVQNVKSGYAQSDFVSRFNEVEPCHGQVVASIPSLPVLTKASAEASQEEVVINLYGSIRWRQLLVGGLELSDGRMIYADTEFMQAIKSNKRVRLLNGPNKDPLYQLFWQKLKADGQINGVKVDMRRITHGQGYDWRALAAKAQFVPAEPGALFANEAAKLLNMRTFKRFMPHMMFNNTTKKVEKVTGLLDGSVKHLRLLVGAALSGHQWARLLATANRNGVSLEVALLNGGRLLPPVLQAVYRAQSASKAKTNTSHTSTAVESGPRANPKKPLPLVRTNDVRLCVRKLAKQDFAGKPVTVMDVSELTSDNLLYKIQVKRKRKSVGFDMAQIAQEFLVGLERGRCYILVGKFKRKLLDALLPYVQQYRNQLRLVSTASSSFLPYAYQRYDVSGSDRLKVLSKQWCVAFQKSGFSLRRISEMPMQKIIALVHYQKAHPGNKDIDAPWRAYRRPFSKIKLPAFNSSTAADDAARFLTRRKSTIDAVLKHSPFVFIGGLSGIGKSTFIEGYFKQHCGDNLFVGEDKLEQWVAQGGYLFIDEANATPRDWLEFSGLFRKPASVCIKGRTVFLNPKLKHKVIFAGNPLGFAGRHQPALFEQHGSAVWFNPLPPNVIYQNILLHIFKGTTLADHDTVNRLSSRLLAAYALLVKHSSHALLVTPRQLKAVAMLTVSEHQRNSSMDAMVIMDRCIRCVLRRHMPASGMKEFDQLFPAAVHTSKAAKPYWLGKGANRFLVTASRESTVELLSMFLRLRDYRRKRGHALNDVQLRGDLSSIILESMPGLGKTKMLQALMSQHGIRKAPLNSRSPLRNAYYLLPVSASMAKKKAIITKAFKEGNIVIMDEMNGALSMERFFNELVLKKPEPGQLANSPGFMLIGTQNPGSLGARQLQSHAQFMRAVLEELKAYPRKEVESILRTCTRDELKISAMAGGYDLHRRDAHRHERVAMTLRELLDEVKKNHSLPDLAPRASSASVGVSTTATTAPSAGLFDSAPVSHKRPQRPKTAAKRKEDGMRVTDEQAVFGSRIEGGDNHTAERQSKRLPLR